eukprot:432307-Rhodomonas_salina.1
MGMMLPALQLHCRGFERSRDQREVAATVIPYALAMPCPVLTYVLPTPSLCHVRVLTYVLLAHSLCRILYSRRSYALPMPCLVLTYLLPTQSLCRARY